MEILGIGPLELLFIVLIALVILGPKDMIKAGKTIGRAMRTIVSSDTWHIINQASREIRNLPTRLMRESGLDEIQKQIPSQGDLSKQLGLDDLNKSLESSTSVDLSPWTTSPETIAPPSIQEDSAETPPDGASEEPQEALAPANSDTTDDQAESPEARGESS